MEKGELVQYDTPENILKHPANEFVKEFVGNKRIWNSPEFIKVKDIMITRPITCKEEDSKFYCINKMRMTKVDSLMVVNEERELIGILYAESLTLKHHKGKGIKDVIEKDIVSVEENDSIKSYFQKLMNSPSNWFLLSFKCTRHSGSRVKTPGPLCLYSSGIQKLCWCHNYRIFHPRSADSVGNTPRHCPYVSLPVSPYLGFIAHSAQRNTHVGLLHGSRQRFCYRSHSSSRRSDKTEDRTVAILCQGAYRKEFQNTFFHLLQSVMILIQYLFRILNIIVVFRRFIPRHFEKRLDISTDHSILRR